MFKKYKLNKILFFLPLLTLMFCFNSPKNEDEKMQTIMVSVKNTLSYLHYSPKLINDAYSKDVYVKYFEMVDPAKRYFLQSDMNEFSKHETKLDDYLNQGDLTFFKLTNSRILQRVDEIDKMTKDILSKPINLDEEDVLILEPKNKKVPTNQAELYNEWKRYIKYNILQEMETLNAKEETQKMKKDSVQKFKLQDTIKLNILTPEQKYTKAKEEVGDLISDSFRRFKKVKEMDWFSRYMNAYTEVFDPHTNYYSPKDKEDFDVSFTGKIIGIGAIIQEKRGNLYLGALTVGAPAWKSKQLTEGDKILKVKSLPNSEPVNMVGMLSDEAVRYIRGEKGTQVTLTVEKKDKSIKEVTMTREEVSIEDTFARSIVIDNNGEKYGFINLPGFNANFNDEKDHNASDDIKAELIKLKAQNVKGIILDLRNNGGGSLTEVGDIMGLFMDAGPYVQVKDGNGKITTLKNKNNEPIWTGPLVVMQNELSASASEIFAGMIQDYGRGLVIGSPQSFGKGTVQTFVDLNRFLNTSDDFGSLKLTIQKFYRITGESTQRKGINSDVVMNDFFTYSEIGERFDENALAWDKIPSAAFPKKSTYFDIKKLENLSAARMKNNEKYQLLLESATWKKSLDKEETITLNQKKFFEVMKERKAQIKKFDKLDKVDSENDPNSLKFAIYQDEIIREKTDEAFKKKTENWIKNLKKDFYLKEAVNIIADMNT